MKNIHKVNRYIFCIVSFILTQSCNYPKTPQVQYNINGTLNSFSGKIIQPRQLDVYILDYENTKAFNGGRYSYETRLSVNKKGEFNGAFNGPQQPCDIKSFKFNVVLFDSVKNEFFQPFLIDSLSQIACQPDINNEKKVTFKLVVSDM